MRLFLAIELEDAVRAAVAALQARLRAEAPDADVRWVEPANFHVTVKFLGEQPDARLSEIREVCAEVAAATPPFALGVRGAGAFPRRGPLKTLWVGVGEGADAWRALARRAEAPLAPFGVPREGGLAPHVTLGRVKSGGGKDALRAALENEGDTDCGRQIAGHVTLIESRLDPRGAVYKNVDAWPFSRQATNDL